DVSVATMTVAYSDSGLFNLILNKTGIINTGNPEFLTGYVYIKSDAKNNDSLVIPINFLIADSLEALVWDTVSSTDFGAKAFPFTGDFVGLAVNNIGSAGGSGLGGVNMDFTIAGGECDTTGNADVYLYETSLFLLKDNGATVDMSTSMYSQGFVDPVTFKPQVPDPGEGMQGGANASYDSVFTGVFANWDTSIVFERTYYSPRNNDNAPSFVIAKTVMYAPDGAAVTGLSVGSMADWDVPADEGSNNTAGVSIPTATLYIQGTDTLKDPDDDCQDNNGRFAAEAFFGYHTATELGGDACANNPAFYGAWADSFHGWWDDAIADMDYAEVLDSVTANVSLNANSGNWDQAAFTTYLNNYTLPAGETVTFYTAFVTLKSGTISDFEFAIDNARVWYLTNLRPSCEAVGACCIAAECYILSEDQCTDAGGSYVGDGTTCDPNPCLSCCVGTRGNVQLEPNCNPADQGVDVGDLTNLIDHLFINFTAICCPDEADIAPAISGGVPDNSVDVGDLTAMIDHLFINFPVLPSCM
ncbi:MAG: hypothetical protein KKA42_09920, partial [candidate division Zixibacteria bacterium]|nr:hypothetical protein [candidate division Zixibacteria bacterium]